MPRPGNSPKRRIAPDDATSHALREVLPGRVRYVGSGHHKRNPADYGLDSTHPRPTKSLRDFERVIRLDEARAMLLDGIALGLFSLPDDNGFPKYIWSVRDGVVYESKTDRHGSGEYHGYPIFNEEAVSAYVHDLWMQRCRIAGR